MTVRVVLADDHAAIRQGLRMMLDAEPDIDVVGEAGDGAAAVVQVRALAPDVVLMDVRMPGTDGIEATRQVTASTGSRVLVLTSFDVDEYVFDALRAGASGYLLKTASADDLVAAVRAVAAGDAVLAPAVTRTVVDAFARTAPPTSSEPPGLASLTDREREVLATLGEGLTNRQIATRLSIEETTVKTHVARVLQKLGLQSRVQAAILTQGL